MSRLRITALFWLTVGIPNLLADWPEFRGPTKDGIVHNELPQEWSPDRNIVWRSELPGLGWSSPVVVGNMIYVTSAIPTDSDSEDSGFHLASSSLTSATTAGRIRPNRASELIRF